MVGGLRPGVFALAAFVLGCGSVLTQPAPDGGATDTATDAPHDAAACECRVQDFTLTMSWACFCAKFGCADREPPCAPNRTTYPSCGLTADNLATIAGPASSVW